MFIVSKTPLKFNADVRRSAVTDWLHCTRTLKMRSDKIRPKSSSSSSSSSSSYSCFAGERHLRSLILIKTSALYEPYTYLLTYIASLYRTTMSTASTILNKRICLYIVDKPITVLRTIRYEMMCILRALKGWRKGQLHFAHGTKNKKKWRINRKKNKKRVSQKNSNFNTHIHAYRLTAIFLRKCGLIRYYLDYER